MANVIEFERKNPFSAAIDVGSERIFVSCDGQTVTSYSTFTDGYRACIQELKRQKIRQVCMEATGVYWIALYQMLEQSGFGVCIVNPKEVKQLPGRKTDVRDAAWMQRLFCGGLVRQSYIPTGLLREIRMMIREREDIIRMGSTYVNKMQKALELMNIKLTQVISQIHGASGISIIEAIISGERDKHRLLSLCHVSIRNKKSEDVLKSLDGHYNESWIFLLEQNLNLWKIHQQHIDHIDKRIEQLLEFFAADKPEVTSKSKPKPIRHHKPDIKDLHQKLLNIYGVDVNSIPGINNYTLLRILGEVGLDMSRFPTVKHFVSWCGLAPGHNQSGLKFSRSKFKNSSPAGQIFRETAQALMNSKHVAIGAFMRKLRGRKDSRIAIKAGARKVAEAFYHLLTKGNSYVEKGIAQYELQIKQREQKYLRKLAAKHGFQVIDIQGFT